MGLLINPFRYGSGAYPDFAYLSSKTSTTSSGTHTFSSVALPAPDGDRWIIVGVSSQRNPASAAPIGSVTVAGSAATLIDGWEVNGHGTHLFAVHLPTGTSGDIVVTNISGTNNRRAIFVWRAILLSGSTAPHDTVQLAGNPSPSGNLDIPAGGFCVAIANAFDANAFTPWTGLDVEQADFAIGGDRRVTAAQRETASLLSGELIRANHPSSAASLGVAASWQL